jgi:thiol-disulfide isomerase/thioredoxin
MESRLPIVAGLASGALATVLLIVVIVALGPDPGVVLTTPTPDLTAAAGSPTGAVPTSAPPTSTAQPSPGAKNFHIDEPAPPLVVPQVGGGTIDLAMLRGKPVWVNFMGTYCPPCRDEFPLMSGFYARYAEQGLIVIAIDVREEEGTIAAFAQELNATFPIGLDADGDAARAWDAIVLPVHFWVDAEGIIRDGALGGIGPDIMAAGLQTIMPDVDVTP